jgi:hypothetical protein
MLRSVVVRALDAAATLGKARVAKAAAAKDIAYFCIDRSPYLPVATRAGLESAAGETGVRCCRS